MMTVDRFNRTPTKSQRSFDGRQNIKAAALQQRSLETTSSVRISDGKPNKASVALKEQYDAIMPSQQTPALTSDLLEISKPTTIDSPEIRAGRAPLIRLSPSDMPTKRYKTLKQWIGEITEVHGNSIWATLADESNENQIYEIVELLLEEFPHADHDLIVPGSTFYWSIGFEITRGGTEKRMSEIRMRRHPKWSKLGIESIEIRAAQLMERINQNAANTTQGQ